MSLRSCSRSYTAENRYKINKSTKYIITKSLTGRWIHGFEAAKRAIVYSSDQCPGHYLGAAIFHGNRLLATGNNTGSKTKPGNTAVKPNGTEYDISCHAEQMAVDGIKHYGYENLKLILYVVRVNSDDKYTTSRPCNMCIDYMKKYGIKIVRFINKNGAPEEMAI